MQFICGVLLLTQPASTPHLTGPRHSILQEHYSKSVSEHVQLEALQPKVAHNVVMSDDTAAWASQRRRALKLSHFHGRALLGRQIWNATHSQETQAGNENSVSN